MEPTVLLGDKPSVVSRELMHTSMTKAFTGGYIEFLATLVFLVAALLVVRLLRGGGVLGDWVTSCAAAGAVAAATVNITAGFAAGAAAIYDGHHGASVGTVTAVNDIRNFAFFLSGGFYALFALGVAVAVLTTGLLPRWIAYTGIVVGVLYIATIPAAGTGVINLATLLGFVWVVALGVAALRRPRTVRAASVPPRVMASA
jgi:hypothetical protein